MQSDPSIFFISQVHVFLLVVILYGRKQCDVERQGTGFKDLDIASAVNYDRYTTTCLGFQDYEVRDVSRPDREFCGGKHLALADAY